MWQNQASNSGLCSFPCTTQQAQGVHLSSPICNFLEFWIRRHSVTTDWDLGRKKTFLELTPFVIYTLVDNVIMSVTMNVARQVLIALAEVSSPNPFFAGIEMLLGHPCVAYSPAGPRFPCSGLTGERHCPQPAEQDPDLHQIRVLSTASLSVVLMRAKLWFKFPYGFMNVL